MPTLCSKQWLALIPKAIQGSELLPVFASVQSPSVASVPSVVHWPPVLETSRSGGLAVKGFLRSLPPPVLESGQSSGYQRLSAEISGSSLPRGFGIKAHPWPPCHPWSACPLPFEPSQIPSVLSVTSC